MWAKVTSKNGDKSHYFIGNESICGRITLTKDDTITYNDDVTDDAKCIECQKKGASQYVFQ